MHFIFEMKTTKSEFVVRSFNFLIRLNFAIMKCFEILTDISILLTIDEFLITIV